MLHNYCTFDRPEKTQFLDIMNEYICVYTYALRILLNDKQKGRLSAQKPSFFDVFN